MTEQVAEYGKTKASSPLEPPRPPDVPEQCLDLIRQMRQALEEYLEGVQNYGKLLREEKP